MINFQTFNLAWLALNTIFHFYSSYPVSGCAAPLLFMDSETLKLTRKTVQRESDLCRRQLPKQVLLNCQIPWMYLLLDWKDTVATLSMYCGYTHSYRWVEWLDNVTIGLTRFNYIHNFFTITNERTCVHFHQIWIYHLPYQWFLKLLEIYHILVIIMLWTVETFWWKIRGHMEDLWDLQKITTVPPK